MKLGITEFIDCAHHLSDHRKCGFPHGHTYRIDVTIESEFKGGMIIDFGELKEKVRSVLIKYDHRDWNDFLEQPTVENICKFLYDELGAKIDFPLTLRVWEGDRKWAEL